MHSDISEIFVFEHQVNLKEKVAKWDDSLRVIAIPEIPKFFSQSITLQDALIYYTTYLRNNGKMATDEYTEIWKKLTKKDYAPVSRQFYPDETMRREGDMLVWWIPQLPMKPFYVACDNLVKAKLVLDTLARYDLFQYENNVKGDYANMGGLLVFSDEGWVEWDDANDGRDINQVLREE